jgi:phage terminase large subunit-like protein
MIERAKAYIDDVLTGRVPAGKYIRLAMERHVRDMERQRTPKFPFYFSEEHAQHVFDAFSTLKLAKGKESGKPFDLMPYQAAILYMAYGWRRVDSGLRRFKQVYIKVPRGNAKTEFLAGVGTYAFVYEGEQDPEVYWVATKKDQSKVGWGRQKRMIERLLRDEPELKKVIGTSKHAVFTQEGLGWVSFLGKDSETEDGAAAFYGLFDEIHAYKDDDMVNVVESSMSKRDDTMSWFITTAGYVPNGPHTQFLKGAKDILDGILENDEMLVVVYEMDKGDDWKNESIWQKVNPGWGVSVKPAAIHSEFLKIKTRGLSKEIDFRVKHLNEEFQSKDAWIPDEKWQNCERSINLEALRGRPCYGGLDLANTSDFNAFALIFPPVDFTGKAILLVWLWLPHDIAENHPRNRFSYMQWERDGYIKLTPGDVTDYDIIEADITALRDECGFVIQTIGFDRAYGAYLIPRLMAADFRMEPVTQSGFNLTPDTKELERLIRKMDIHHSGNKALRWMLGNVVIHRDTNNNYRVDKGRSPEKIDGISATINALHEWVLRRDELPVSSYLLDDDTELITF